MAFRTVVLLLGVILLLILEGCAVYRSPDITIETEIYNPTERVTRNLFFIR